MADVFPFAAYRFNPAVVGDLARALTQPYDKITPAMQERYYQSSPHNLVRVILRKPGAHSEQDIYTGASETLNEWIASGVLARDHQPCFYAYAQTFSVPGAQDVMHTRRGLIVLGQLEDYESRIVFPHEKTLDGPKRDRLQLLRATRTHCEQLFMLYSDPEKVIDGIASQPATQPPLTEAEDEYGVVSRVWKIADKESIRLIQRALHEKKLLIADGHHRYETALAYRDECRRSLGGKWERNVASERVPMTLVNSESEGLVILSTHRVVENLSDFSAEPFVQRTRAFFDVSPFPAGASASSHDVQRRLAEEGLRGPVIACALPAGQKLLLRFRDDERSQEALHHLPEKIRHLDVVLLHELLFRRCLGLEPSSVSAGGHIRYLRELRAAEDEVENGRAQVAFLLNPVKIAQVFDAAVAGVTLPQKSTDFYPKLLSGLTLYRLDE